MSVCQIRGGLLLWASVFLCLSSTTLLAAPCGGVGNLSGVVFNDFNGDQQGRHEDTEAGHFKFALNASNDGIITGKECARSEQVR